MGKLYIAQNNTATNSNDRKVRLTHFLEQLFNYGSKGQFLVENIRVYK